MKTNRSIACDFTSVARGERGKIERLEFARLPCCLPLIRIASPQVLIHPREGGSLPRPSPSYAPLPSAPFAWIPAFLKDRGAVTAAYLKLDSEAVGERNFGRVWPGQDEWGRLGYDEDGSNLAPIRIGTLFLGMAVANGTGRAKAAGGGERSASDSKLRILTLE